MKPHRTGYTLSMFMQRYEKAIRELVEKHDNVKRPKIWWGEVEGWLHEKNVLAYAIGSKRYYEKFTNDYKSRVILTRKAVNLLMQNYGYEPISNTFKVIGYQQKPTGSQEIQGQDQEVSG